MLVVKFDNLFRSYTRYIFSYEKGYAYTTKRIAGNLVKAPTLDDFPNEKIVARADPETWLYREVEPNWYVYYRYFYRYTDNISSEYEGE